MLEWKQGNLRVSSCAFVLGRDTGICPVLLYIFDGRIFVFESVVYVYTVSEQSAILRNIPIKKYTS